MGFVNAANINMAWTAESACEYVCSSVLTSLTLMKHLLLAGLSLCCINANATLSNQASSIGDYNANSRFELSFLGGTNTYSIFDGSGQVDTGIGFTDAGLHIVFELTSTSTYRLYILNAFNPAINPFSTTGNLSGSGSIDSVSLFNRDAEDANAYCNALSIGRQLPIIAVSAPSSLALFSIAFITLLKRKKISLNS